MKNAVLYKRTSNTQAHTTPTHACVQHMCNCAHNFKEIERLTTILGFFNIIEKYYRELEKLLGKRPRYIKKDINLLCQNIPCTYWNSIIFTSEYSSIGVRKKELYRRVTTTNNIPFLKLICNRDQCSWSNTGPCLQAHSEDCRCHKLYASGKPFICRLKSWRSRSIKILERPWIVN